MIEKQIEEKLRDYCFYLYQTTLPSRQVKIDFTRCVLQIPPNQYLTAQMLEQLSTAIKHSTMKAKRYGPAEAKEINKILKEEGSNLRCFIGARKEGFPILLFGPVNSFKLSGFTVYVLEKELVRSPAAVLTMAALTTQEHEIIIRRPALKYLFWQKWVKAVGRENQDQFINEMIEVYARHEVCHAVISRDYPDQDNLALAKLLNAMVENCSLRILDELMAEWMPPQGEAMGAIPYLAKMAQKDYSKAKRIFYQYIEDTRFRGIAEQEDLHGLTELFMKMLAPYQREDGEIQFDKILKDAPQIYQFFFGRFNSILSRIRRQIEKAAFVFNGIEVSYWELAKAQRKTFARQNSDIEVDSPLYKRYFWGNMINYLKKYSPLTFLKIKKELKKGEDKGYNLDEVKNG